MTVVRGDFSNHLSPGAAMAFASEYETLTTRYPSLFNVHSSERAFEDHLVSTGLGTAAEKPEGEDIPSDQPYDRASVRYTHKTYGLSYEVSREAREDDLYGAIVPPASRFLAASLTDTEETQAAAIVNNGLAGTQNSYDGVALFATTHTTIGAGTQANKPSSDGDLGVATLQASKERFMDLKDDRGLRLRMRPGWLVSGPQQDQVMDEILQSQFKPFTANNEVNTHAGTLNKFVWEYMTDTDAWFTLASDHNVLHFFVRRSPEFKSTFDEDAEVAKFATTARFSAGATDWRGIDGSTGA